MARPRTDGLARFWRNGILAGLGDEMTKWLMTVVRIWGCFVLAASPLSAQGARGDKAVNRVILDTDIGDDIDDAFALALALRSPEIELIGITTAWGDTLLRARLANRLVQEAGSTTLPVLAGVRTTSKTNFTQADWAKEGAAAALDGDAVE